MKSKNEIEPKIKPLVQSLNNIGILTTFSSCQGHFEPEDQELMDRNHADVRFDPKKSVSEQEIDLFLTYLMTEFNNRHSFAPVGLRAYKLFTPCFEENNIEVDAIYIIELIPFDRFDTGDEKRKYIDIAIPQAVKIVDEWKKLMSGKNS